jgi:hypothetical protein
MAGSSIPSIAIDDRLSHIRPVTLAPVLLMILLPSDMPKHQSIVRRQDAKVLSKRVPKLSPVSYAMYACIHVSVSFGYIDTYW